MSIHKVLISFDAMFRSSRIQPVIINDLPMVTDEDRVTSNSRIFHEYDNDVFNTTPSCDCGHTRKEYLIGVKCVKCNTPVQSILERDLEPQMWMRRPAGVAKFINPMVWILLRDFFKEGTFDVLQYICSTDYRPKKLPDIVTQLQSAGIEQGYNNFVNNFDKIMNTMLDMPRYNKGDKKEKREALLATLNRYKYCIFSDHIPVINKNLMIIENKSMGRYVDHTIPMAVNAMRLLLGIDTGASRLGLRGSGESRGVNLRARENRTCKMLTMLCDFFIEYFKTNVASKPGLARKHLCSTLSNWSARSVITSLTMPHEYDELHIPWGVAIGIFRIHLFNRLTHMGFLPNQIFGMLSSAVERYSPLIDGIFKDLIAKSPENGIAVSFCRNPSLARSSMQRMRITRIKTDPQDPTIGMSILSVSGFNARQDLISN